MIKFTLYGNPKSKKNSQQIFRNNATGKPFITQSQAYKQFEKDCLSQITGKHKLHINYPVNIKAVFYRNDNTRVDITNLLSALHDILTKAGVIADDNFKIVVSVDGSRVLIDKENPRTEIEIEEAHNG